MPPLARLQNLVLFAALLAPVSEAVAQVYVAPRRPGQSRVQSFEHDWRYIDLMVDEEIADQTSGGVRLFFDVSERDMAERAAAELELAYRDLADSFGYTPGKRFPYVVYGSYPAFLQTNLFPVQEGTLGVTSTRGDLEVSLPYLGDPSLFAHVSKHELAHQFTIQKVRARAGDVNADYDPLRAIPLWFVEGLAEYYAWGGIDEDTRARVRDLTVNPDLWRSHGLPHFWADWPGNVLWTYKLGQVRIAFLEEVYGEGTTQKILDESGQLGLRRTRLTFRELVEQVTGDEPPTVRARFDEWVKRKAFEEWLDAEQTRADLAHIDMREGFYGALAASPTGNTLLVRNIDRYTGRRELLLIDPRDADSPKRIVRDDKPGVESLHPIDERNFALDDEQLVFVAASRGRDLLVHRTYRQNLRLSQEAPDDIDEDAPEPEWKASFRLGHKTVFDLSKHDIISATSPSLAPDGGQVVFIGLRASGERDLFVIDLDSGDLRDLTHDLYAERHTTWGPDGIVYSSDATEHGYHDLFRISGAGGEPERLTNEPVEHADPVVLPNGQTYFVAFDDGARDLHEWTEDGVIRRTDIDTALGDPAPGPAGSLWALHTRGGQLEPVKIPETALLDKPPKLQPLDVDAEPWVPGELDLSAAQTYRPAQPRHWRIDNGFGMLGVGTAGVYGQLALMASDALDDHALILQGSIWGTPRLMDARLMYIDQGGRLTWGLGIGQTLRYRVDNTFDDLPTFQSIERQPALTASLRIPADRFLHLQLDQSIGITDYFLYNSTRTWLDDKAGEWDDANANRFQTTTTARFGYDTVGYHATVGPSRGASVMVEGTLITHPVQGDLYGAERVDAQVFLPLPLIEGLNIAVRSSAGASQGGRYAESYFLQSYDTLRSVRFGDTSWLLGRHYAHAGANLRIPLSEILRTPAGTGLVGIAGFDFGAIDDDPLALWDKRVLDGALGVDLLAGPMAIRMHWARAINVGAPMPYGGGVWVPNISLSWAGY